MPHSTPLPSTFGEWVYTLRNRRGWTQKRLADEVGVTKTYISLLERSINHPTSGIPRKPSLDVVDRIAAALGGDQDAARIAAGYLPNSPLVVFPESGSPIGSISGQVVPTVSDIELEDTIQQFEQAVDKLQAMVGSSERAEALVQRLQEVLASRSNKK